MEFELSIIIPSYNEMKTIPHVLKKINSLSFSSRSEVIVVDDGSDDGTYDYLSSISDNFSYKLFVLRHSENLGKGAALKTAISYSNGKYLIIQDADLEYDPQNIELIYEKLVKSGCDVVFGSRLINPNKIYNKLYLFGNKFITFLINSLFGSNYTDAYTCYKAFKKNVANSLNLFSKGFEVEAEIASKIALKKYGMMEVGIVYVPRSREEGKKIDFWDFVKGIFTVLKIKFLSFMGRI